MNLIPGGDLVDRLLADQGLQGNPGLEFSGRFASLSAHRSVSIPLWILEHRFHLIQLSSFPGP